MADPATGDGSGPADAAPAPSGDLPEIDFSTFALSLSTSALVSLGLVEDPATGKRAAVDLGAARNTIDILEMLKRKTRGNLEPEELRLLESLLYELRMRCVEAEA